jgi:hypothetical protein
MFKEERQGRKKTGMGFGKETEMTKSGTRKTPKKWYVTRENLFAAAYLFFFAVILLSSDPEWLMWAGPITLGAFPLGIPQTALSFDPLEAFRAAGSAAFLGLSALAVLFLAGDDWV